MEEPASLSWAQRYFLYDSLPFYRMVQDHEHRAYQGDQHPRSHLYPYDQALILRLHCSPQPYHTSYENSPPLVKIFQYFQIGMAR